jgi:type I restriction enzyme S subunit
VSQVKSAERAVGLRRLAPYKAYKDSGVEWLGELPAHWEVLNAGRLINRIEQGWSPVAEDRQAGPGEWAVIKLSAVAKGSFLSSEHKALPLDLAPDTRYEISDGDFLLTRANTPDLVGDVCVVRGAPPRLMLCDLVYRLNLRRDRVAPEFFAYWFLSPTGRYQIEVEARGSSQSMVKVSQGLIRAWMTVLPPIPDQRAITAFLDRETARIDALVARKERLIDLLQEKRTVLITRAVTKGLDRNVPMKPSGVEWLGEIPAHWVVKRLGQAMESLMDFRGRTPLKLDMDWGGDIPAVSAVNVREGYLDLSRGVNYGSQALHDRWMAQGPTRRGDVLFTTEAPLGNVALVPDDKQYILSQRVVLLRPHSAQLIPGYLQRFLICSAFRQGVELQATGSTAEGVKRRYLMAMPVCVPHVEEQRVIADFLDRETTRIDALVAKVRHAIDRLRELRTALISAAVTGKIDVREEIA